MKFHRKHMRFKIQHLQHVSFIYYITIYKVWFTEQILNFNVFLFFFLESACSINNNLQYIVHFISIVFSSMYRCTSFEYLTHYIDQRYKS